MKVDKTKWKYTRLDNLVHILNGFAFKSDCYCQKGIRVIRITNVQDGYIEDTDPKFYPVSYSNELSKYILHENDLLISLTGNVGRVAFLPQEMLPAALNQRVACIRSQNSTTISLEFLYFFMMNKTFKDDCIKSSKGVAQLNMSTEWLKSYIIPIPPHIEQQAIAAELNAIQTMIDGYKAQIADLDALAQSIFLDMFDMIKEKIPDCTITTDIIVGFPNETEEQFQDTLSLYNYCKYDLAYTFIYSPREGTPAAKMEDNVPLSDKEQRLYRLNELVNKYANEANQKYLGQVVKVLVEGPSKKNPDVLSGYTEHNKLINFKGDASMVGQIVDVRVTEAKTWVLTGEQLESNN